MKRLALVVLATALLVGCSKKENDALVLVEDGHRERAHAVLIDVRRQPTR